jgi:CheY-like chemotaxis protein
MSNGQGAILVVEDDEDIREVMLETLQDEGYRVVGAPDGAAALAFLRSAESRPVVMLLDLMMPGMNGAEFRAEQIKDPALATIPVILLSADSRLEEKYADLGGAGFLRKPIKLDALLDTVARFARALDWREVGVPPVAT